MPDVAIQFFRDSTSKHCTGKALNSTFTFSAISAREAEFPPHSTTWHGWCYISWAQNLSHAYSWFNASEEGEMTTRPHLPLTTNPPPTRAKTCIPGIYHSQDKKWHRQLLSIATLERLSLWQVEEVLPVTQGLLTWDASFAPLACDWVFCSIDRRRISGHCLLFAVGKIEILEEAWERPGEGWKEASCGAESD